MAFRSEFTVLSVRITGSSRFRLIIYSVLFLAFYSVFGFYLLNHQFNRKVTFVNIMRDYQYSILGTGHNTLIARTRRARWFEDSIPLMAAGVIIVAFSSVFVPADISALILSLKHSDIVKLIHKYGKNGLSYLSIMPDKSLYFSLSGKSFVAYKLVSGVMVILGDPVGPITDSELLVQQLINETQKKGIGLVFFQASEKLIKNYHRHHLRRLRIGYDAVIRLHRFSLEGAPMKNLRNSVSHIEKSDIRFFVYKMSSIPKNIQPQISQLYTGWIESHKDIKMTFSLNFYPFPKTESAYVLVSKDSSGRILSVCSFYPYSNNRAVNLDLMVRASDAPNGLMETAIVKAINYFKNKKFQYLNLGFAAKHDEARPVSSGLRLFYKYFGTFYNFSSILNFKSKFSPDWQPKYMVYSPNVSLAKILLAILQVHTS